MGFFQNAMLKAKALTLQGKLMEATRVIQQGLAGPEHAAQGPATARQADDAVALETAVQPRAELAMKRAPFAAPPDIEDIDFHEVPKPVRPETAPEVPEEPVAAPQAPRNEAPSTTNVTPSSFSVHTFASGLHTYRYRVFVPTGAGEGLPVVVMLHGCKQDSDDFAKGTAMNAVAEREKFIVVYPEQLRQGNSLGCWNWFEPAHQQRGQGEPAMIAALAAHVAAEHRADPARIYVAGLSAGGAMAAIVGNLYPDVFAAVGIHSGLAAGSARDVASAFSAMRSGPGATAALRAVALPVIVFQGTGDKTVAPANADRIVRQEVAAWAQKGVTLSQTQTAAPAQSGSRSAAVARWADAEGKVLLEVWTVAAAPHAWAGGNASGSFTDPAGPDASNAMLRFFRRHAQG